MDFRYGLREARGLEAGGQRAFWCGVQMKNAAYARSVPLSDVGSQSCRAIMQLRNRSQMEVEELSSSLLCGR
jgi:hypothetical protein